MLLSSLWCIAAHWIAGGARGAKARRCTTGALTVSSEREAHNKCETRVDPQVHEHFFLLQALQVGMASLKATLVTRSISFTLWQRNTGSCATVMALNASCFLVSIDRPFFRRGFRVEVVFSLHPQEARDGRVRQLDWDPDLVAIFEHHGDVVEMQFPAAAAYASS